MAYFYSAGDALRWAWHRAPHAGETIQSSAIAGLIGLDSRESFEEAISRIPRSIELERLPRGRDASHLAGDIKRIVTSFDLAVVAHHLSKEMGGREWKWAHEVLHDYLRERGVAVPGRLRLAWLIIDNIYHSKGRVKLAKREIEKKAKVSEHERERLERAINIEIEVLAFHAQALNVQFVENGIVAGIA